jgi:DNA-binding transcriptional LysR family regulator
MQTAKSQIAETACRRGGPYVFGKENQVEDALRAGRLIEVLRSDVPEPLPVHLLFEASRSGAAAIRAFIEAMRNRGRAQGWR